MMNAIAGRRNAHRAYGRVQRWTLSGRSAEAEAFARAAAHLTRAAACPRDRYLLTDALAFNQKLWAIMEAEVSDPDHPAPDRIKADMLALADFMDQATTEALKTSDAARLNSMIAVNASLSKGLFETP